MDREIYKTIQYIKEYLESCLEELYEEEDTNDFIYGEKTAYVDCLELLQKTMGTQITGVNYVVEERYPLLSNK